MDRPQGSKIHYFLNSLFTNQYKMETVGNRWQPSRWLEYNRCSQPSTPCLPTKTELQLLQPAHFRLRWIPPTENTQTKMMNLQTPQTHVMTPLPNNSLSISSHLSFPKAWTPNISPICTHLVAQPTTHHMVILLQHFKDFNIKENGHQPASKVTTCKKIWCPHQIRCLELQAPEEPLCHNLSLWLDMVPTLHPMGQSHQPPVLQDTKRSSQFPLKS